MTYKFTSLQHSIEKLLEAEYFLVNLTKCEGLEFQYNLNAFLAACRSISLVLQKSMSSVPEFRSWYLTKSKEMQADSGMKFFVELRNISLHEGPVSFIGGNGPAGRTWTYRFAGNREKVPSCIQGKDVASACAEHLVKLATLLQSFNMEFPYRGCIRKALTIEGMTTLGFALDDVARILGLPSGYLDTGDAIPMADKLRLLSKEFDYADIEQINRIRAGEICDGDTRIIFYTSSGSDLVDDVASIIDNGNPDAVNSKVAFITAIGKRIRDFEEK